MHAVTGLELERGDQSLKSADVLAQEGLVNDAISRAYYAVLHYARALLATRDLSPKSHHAALLLFSREFVKTGAISTEIGRIIARLQKFRENADYSAYTSFSRDDASAAVADARTFRAAVAEQLAACCKSGDTP